jgi:aminoglycoside phosphotransferase (APT) family kinase protein
MIDLEVDVNLLRARLAGIAAVDLRPLTGGASSLSYIATATVAGLRQQVVVKVAPPGLAPVRNRDVLRQAKMLRRLADTAVPVPDVLFEDPGEPPDIPPLFVMSFVEGSSLEPLFDHHGVDEPAVVAERMHEAARALGALHVVDPGAMDLGVEPHESVGNEISRWSRALATVDEALVPGWEEVRDLLLATEPMAMTPTIVHGDYRLGNLLSSGSSVLAVIDWEIWSLGDPRVDLGWFLINADPATYRRATRYADKLPALSELAETYRGCLLGRDLVDLGWFRALACFKSAATWSLIIKHSRRRPVPDETAEEIASSLPSLLARAASLVG